MPHIPTRAVVWLDHHEARVFLITADDVERERIKAHPPHRQVHHKANEVGSGLVPESALGRAYRDLLGRVNQRASTLATHAWLLVSGRALPLPPTDLE